MMETFFPTHPRHRHAIAVAGVMRGAWPNVQGVSRILFSLPLCWHGGVRQLVLGRLCLTLR